MNSKARARLVHLLISKSIVEALLIAGVAVAFFFATTNPYFRGVLDTADKTSVAGWAVDESRPYERVEVQLFIDDRFVSAAFADQLRPDVHEAKRAQDDWHGFVFSTPRLPVGNHEARVYAVHSNGSGVRKTLQLIGKPYRFHTE
jgi:hypothetical protein